MDNIGYEWLFDAIETLALSFAEVLIFCCFMLLGYLIGCFLYNQIRKKRERGQRR